MRYTLYGLPHGRKVANSLCWDARPHGQSHWVLRWLNAPYRNVLFADGTLRQAYPRHWLCPVHARRKVTPRIGYNARMALRRRTNSPDPAALRLSELTELLLAEWRSPSDDPKAEPLIVVQNDAPGLPARRLYVVWSQWGDLTQVQRTEVIAHAYEQFLGDRRADADHLSLAMGLLPDEAHRLRIVPS